MSLTEMKRLLFLLFLLFPHVLPLNIASFVAFANLNWGCVDATCTANVTAGTFQPNYQCAEFVSRCLVAGGAIPNLDPYGSQESYLGYSFGGKTYDLLWVSSNEGAPIGLEDLLKVLGWVNVGNDCTQVQAGYVAISTGADGPYSHAFVGVGNELADAHNSARFQVPSCFYSGPSAAINALYAPPTISGTTISPATTTPLGTTISVLTPHNPYCVQASPSLNLRSGPCTTQAVLTTVPKGGVVTSLSCCTSGCGYSWREVSYLENSTSFTGYVADTFLAPCPYTTSVAPHSDGFVLLPFFYVVFLTVIFCML